MSADLWMLGLLLLAIVFLLAMARDVRKLRRTTRAPLDGHPRARDRVGER